MIFTSDDIDFLNSKGISVQEAERQYRLLTAGVKYPELVVGADINTGINTFSSFQTDFKKLYDEQKLKQRIVRFIPASGAASRMFAHLQDYLLNHLDSDITDEFFRSVKMFAFYHLIPEEILNDKQKLIEFVLSDKGLNYSCFPKALIPFHIFNNVAYTAFQSQLSESLEYTIDCDGCSKIHLTISEEFDSFFKFQFKEYLKNSGINESQFSLSFSSQSVSTDTIALDENKHPVRTSDGTLLLRQGGHGSLLSNLNSVDADLIFIRNIDNVVSPSANQDYVNIHRELGGLTLFLRDHLFAIQNRFKNESEISEEDFQFLNSKFNYKGSRNNKDLEKFLFRPLRVCGMVKNQGEPGGGPFFIKETDDSISLQIIESSQVNSNDPLQLKIFKSGSYFNPVDIVCCTKNYMGEKYELSDFSNPDLTFIASKKYNGKNITVLEHPGLWNGSMHHWLTFFVEIPISVFNPVKTVNDLLRPAHQK